MCTCTQNKPSELMSFFILSLAFSQINHWNFYLLEYRFSFFAMIYEPERNEKKRREETRYILCVCTCSYLFTLNWISSGPGLISKGKLTEVAIPSLDSTDSIELAGEFTWTRAALVQPLIEH